MKKYIISNGLLNLVFLQRGIFTLLIFPKSILIMYLDTVSLWSLSAWPAHLFPWQTYTNTSLGTRQKKNKT